MTRKHIPYLLPVILVCAMLLSACDRDDHEHDHAYGIDRIEVRDAASDVLYGVWLHDADGWTGDADLILPEGEEAVVRVTFFDGEGVRVITRDGGEHSLDMRLVSEEDAGVIEWTITDDEVRLAGIEEGEASVVFLLMHGNHSDAESPAFVVAVEGWVPVS